MSYEAALAMPLKTFWLMNRNIDRIQAKKDMRSLSVSIASQAMAGDSKQFREALVIEAGTIVKLEGESDDVANPLEVKRDEAGFAELRMMAKQKIG